jgi:hypothetical protein
MRSQIRNFRTRQRWPALFAIAGCFSLILAGCGSSDVQGTAKEKKEEDRYRYEGTGKAKQKVLIRPREERFKELMKAAKNNPG